MRGSFTFPLFVISALLSIPAVAQEAEIENDVPISAEATTVVSPGKEADTDQTAGQPAAASTKPDRIYTDGALSDPNAKAEDLGMAQPGSKITVSEEGETKPTGQ